MAVFKCKICGGNLDISGGMSVATCEYCGTKQTVPNSRDEVVSNLFNRANNLRLKCEFEKAEQVYEKILDIDNTDPEANWGIVLCKYGIEYVEDPKTYSRIPTCHRTLYDAVLTDVNYISAIKNADEEQKILYVAEAKVIDELQKSILDIVNDEEPFDVFICYKETDESGKRTIDSSIANDIYYQLSQEGFKVFYAPITLEDKLGHEYEPYIFAALNSAKVMLVIGTKPEYFNSVWVRNEWSRFFKTMKSDRSKLLIPCYRDMDVYELPDEFAHLQAQDMEKIGFISDLIRGLRKIFNHDEQPQYVPIKNQEARLNKTNWAKVAWTGLKNKFKSNSHLAFPFPKFTMAFFVFAVIFYIFFLVKVGTSVSYKYKYDMFILSLMGLPFIPPLLIFTKIIKKKATAIISEAISLLLNLIIIFNNISYGIHNGILSVIILMVLLSLGWLVLICLAKQVKNIEERKKKVHIPITSLMVSIVTAVVLEMFGISFLDYQVAKIFYQSGAYEYANEYFMTLGNYKDSANLAKNSLYLHALDLIKQGDNETAIAILEQIPYYRDSDNVKNTALYNQAELLYKERKYKEATEILNELENFADANVLLDTIQNDIKNTASEAIDTSLYTECTVEELYKNPNDYNGKKVAISSWKVVCKYNSQSVIGTFYDFLLCDDLIDYEVEGKYQPIKVYKYYSDYIKPLKISYVGARVFSDNIYTEISEDKSKIITYGTFSYNPDKSEGGYVSDPHVYNLDVDYYIEF